MSRSLFMAVALCVAWAGAAVADSYDGLPVTEIRFSPQDQPVPAARRSALVPLQEGKPLDSEDVRQAIRALFATGRYADIQVDATRTDAGVRITFITHPNYFVGPVRFIGVTRPPTPGELLNATKLELGELYSKEKVDAGTESISRLLADNGFYNAKVEVETYAHTDTQQIDIVYRVRPGVRALFGKIALSGKPDLPVERVRAIANWQEKRRFTQPAIQRGLDRLRREYQKTDHLQASLRIESRTHDPAANRVDVVVEIIPGPKVDVAISGAKLSKKELRRYVPIFEEGTIDNDLLAEGSRNLRDHFQIQGYFDAKVDRGQHQENSDILVEFQAILGQQYDFVKLDIAGNRFFNEATIRERMYLQPKNLQYRRGRFSQNLLRNDIASIVDLYQSNGFQSAKIDYRTEDGYGGKQGNWAVYLTIEEGPQTLVSDLKIEGNQSYSTESLLTRLNSVPGQPFSARNVASDRDLILAQYFSEGFPDATMEWKFVPAEEPNLVKLEYTIREGQRQFVNDVIAGGYENTGESLIRRQIVVYPNEALSQSAMVESQRRLYDLGIFTNVNVAIQNPEGKELYRNVLFQIDEARRWTFGVGGGAEIARFGGSQTSLDSPAGDTGFSPRVSFEVNRLNLLGRGYTVSFRSQASTLQKRALLSFLAPRWRGRERLTLSFTALYDTSRNVRTFSASRLEAALQLQHKISKPSTLFYRYSYRRVQVDRDTLKITPGLIPLLSQPVRVGLLSATYAQDRRDDSLDAHRGIYNTVDLGIASKFTGSSASFPRLLIQNSTYHPFGRRIVFARTTQIGGMIPFGALRRIEATQADGSVLVGFTREIPLPERFFSGGSSSHRGFSINQAGPRDPETGFPLGGNAFFLNSIELRMPLRGENIGGVLFHDAGNVYSKPQNVSFRVHQRDIRDFDYMAHAVGIGLRYKTPIGPIRVDLGYALNPPRFHGFKGSREDLLFGRGEITDQRLSHFQFHFSLGQTF